MKGKSRSPTSQEAAQAGLPGPRFPAVRPGTSFSHHSYWQRHGSVWRRWPWGPACPPCPRAQRGAHSPTGAQLARQRWTLGAAPHRDTEPPRGPLPARAPAETLPVTCPSGTPQLSPGPRDPGSHGGRMGPGRAPGAHLCRAQQPSVKGLPRPAVYYLFLCADELKGGINFFPQLPTADLSFSVFVTDTSRLS